jgi:hypothetical protein
MVSPAECEPVILVFDHEGYIYAPWLKQFSTKRFYIYNISTKTQFAGVDTHIKVIELMRHFNKKYLSNFTMIDETDYWETGDKAMVEEKVSFLGSKINAFASGLENTKMKEGESLENFIRRIAEAM